MAKLLRADFRRLWRSRVFYVALLAWIVFAVTVVLARYRDASVLQGQGYDNLDFLLFIAATYSPLLVAAFVSLFVGTEHSDGALRNKLITGSSRIGVYFSNLAVCIVAVLLVHLANIATVLALGRPILGGFSGIAPNTLLVFFFCSLATQVAMTALMLVFAMLIPNKAVNAVLTILLAVGLMMGAMSVQAMLSAPEWVTNNIIYEGGQPIAGETYRNPKYLEGGKRAFFQFLYEFLPSGQLMIFGMSGELPQNVWHLPIYSLLLTMVSTLVGALCFRRRDLK